MKEKVRKGESANLSWVVPYFPLAGYHIYHTVKNSNVILRVNHNGQQESDIKYKYLTRPYNSTNVMFEIKDVTLDDAGYYNGGEVLDKAGSCGGIVLIVNGESVSILKKHFVFWSDTTCSVLARPFIQTHGKLNMNRFIVHSFCNEFGSIIQHF